jgi:DNA-directed RNA polymerase subunit RPC12/RpoP
MPQSQYTCEACGKQFNSMPELEVHTRQCPEVRRLREAAAEPKTRTAGGKKE